MPREAIYFCFLFWAILLSLNMAEASVAIPPDFLEIPVSGESPALPAEKVVCFLSLFLWCSAPSICCVCCAELMLAMVVLFNICRLFSVALAQHLSSFCFVFVASGACLQGSHLGVHHLIYGV